MKAVEPYGRVRYAAQIEGLSNREAARRFGQLLFLAIVLAVFRMITALVNVPIVPVRIVAAYLNGTTAIVWLMLRLGSFVA